MTLCEVCGNKMMNTTNPGTTSDKWCPSRQVDCWKTLIRQMLLSSFFVGVRPEDDVCGNKGVFLTDLLQTLVFPSSK